MSFRSKITLPILLGLLAFGVGAAPAGARTALKSVSYRGVTLRVPRTWPVIRLTPVTCVRFNRHAVYLGTPGAQERCPVDSAGRTEAILAAPAGSGAHLYGSHVTVQRTGRVTITATWRRDPAAIRTALGVHRLPAAVAPQATATPPTVRAARSRRTVSAGTPATPGQVFTGAGFDACAAPSSATMATWGASSPYGAIGVYIGGENMACSQPNLTSSWVAAQSAAGWHLTPIYVGLQAPTNSCGCASITSSQASAEGAAAAVDAVYDAQAIGLGAGNPIDYDMEGYSRTTANSTAVLAFLEAWTEQLHTDGYLSGVYSSDASGVADLAAQYGSTYVEPDELWVAAWNNQANTTDSTLPPTAWANHQRMHQYQGGTDETYGGVTINVDNDDLDAATAAAGASAAPAPVTSVPAASAPPTIEGVPVVGQTLTELHANWSGSPSTYAYQWLRCPRSGGTCAVIPGATAQTYTLTPADRLRTVKVAETAANSVGSSSVSVSVHTPAVYRTPTGYWTFTASGAIDNSEYQLLWGSPGNDGLKDFVGMAASADRAGYWLVTRTGSVYPFGDAVRHPVLRPAGPVHGIVRAGRTGYWLYTADGNVDAANGTPFYGSAARRRLRNITGMAASSNGRGYWLVTSRGYVMDFGRAPDHGHIDARHPVKGIVAAPGNAYWLYTAEGNVYPSRGARFYGSPVHDGVTDVVGMLATPDGRGYWMVTRTGTVYSYGDAVRYPDPTMTGGSVIGLAG